MNIFLVLLVISFIILLVVFYLYLKAKSNLFLSLQNYEQLVQSSKASEYELNDMKLQYAVLQARYEDEIKSSKEKIDVLNNAKDELSKEFKALANQIFEDKSKRFDEAQKQQLELFLKPFREQITNFSTQSKQQYYEQTKDTHLLKDELLRLKQMNEQLSNDALNLTNALKGENKTQGNWGEIILEKILEQSGLREGIEYEIQATLKSHEGRVYRPDVIIHMPKNRDIIVDSKVSLTAYERFMSIDESIDKERALKEHIVSISSHIKGLSEKKYEKLQGVHTLDFVLLFMPIEGAFLLALENDGEFFKRAYESNILVVSPSTLLVTLRTIEHIWRTQRQEEHAKKIADEAEAMYEKLVLFVNEMNTIGSLLQKTQSSYENAMKRLSTGKGNVIRRAENIVELGLKPKKLLQITSEDDN